VSRDYLTEIDALDAAWDERQRLAGPLDALADAINCFVCSVAKATGYRVAGVTIPKVYADKIGAPLQIATAVGAVRIDVAERPGVPVPCTAQRCV
jgi:hypothetical protein